MSTNSKVAFIPLLGKVLSFVKVSTQLYTLCYTTKHLSVSCYSWSIYL